MAKQEQGTPKIGAGHASAMFRQGLAEIRGALYNEGTVAQPTQLGIYGTKTPGEVQHEREASVLGPPQDPAPEQDATQAQTPVLDRYVEKAEARAANLQNDRGAREREAPERE